MENNSQKVIALAKAESPNLRRLPFPSPSDFLINIPLYQTIPIDFIANRDDVGRIFNLLQPIDMYCVECELPSVFRNANSGHYTSDYTVTKGLHQVIVYCSRNFDHVANFDFRVDGNGIAKIGQYPSMADLHSGEIKKYRKILGKEYQELSRAMGLFAHGVGIGAFVYLRRIFEGLIEEAHKEAAKQVNWDADKYLKARMSEKVDLLKDFLPQYLLENNKLYSILSKAIHELTEEECLTYFMPVKISIELILDQKIEQQERLNKMDNMRKSLTAIHNQLT